MAGSGLAESGGIYTVAIGATAIILAGVRPPERHFIPVRQQRNIELLVKRSSVSLDTVHRAPLAGSVRAGQVIVLQSEDDADRDDVQMAAPLPEILT